MLESLPSPLLALLLALPAALHGVAALTAHRSPRDTAWWRAEAASAVGAGLGALLLVLALLSGTTVSAGLRLDAPGATVLLLVGFVGWVIVRFSHRYLQGERGERRYLALISATLAAVSLVLVADHLLLLAAAWIGTSLTLHRLLRFYAERPAARMAAHKKFLAGRIADAALLGAIAVLGAAYGTLSLDAMLAAAAAQGVPPLAQAGLLLLVVTALLKCAQMPLHGWLIQVMEAPTPVSALLHAGVVNLGGFVLIRFAPMLAEAMPAQVLLAVAATATVVMATLVMGTRISVKVMLAWSTVAQMGFMLLQVALGLPAMALLHLVAHSLYKAHAFLSAGGVAQRRQALRLTAPAAPPSATRWALAAMASVATVVGTGLATGTLPTPAAALAGAVLAAALSPLLAAGRVAPALGVAAGWLAGHALASAVVTPVAAAPAGLVIIVAVALAALFVLQALIALRPAAAWVRRLHPWAYGGFHLDEHVSAWLFARWPIPPAPAALPPSPATEGARA
ncbi:NADH-quinone oxidoreductase subunit L [Rubrivivax albus]|uniref:Probable inorganic carbon transporter subunit DabB n=1 Tax=Rubrivivax albus TaxID=2499835 RepID=A0A437JSX4_9BURK|nr:NADH-quinone oxidoreductase subunit L [Rubrivivax albus]RVT50148.1 NADH-quinone oxidoreductase subunit L [Rubrivivax albus]